VTVALLSLAGSVIGFLIWLWKRKATKADDKYEQHAKRIQEAEQSIAKGDSDAFNLGLADDLEWLRAHQSDSGGQVGSKDASGKNVHPGN
jgi:hypothetical protein